MAHAAGYNSAWSTARSTGVHEVHRHRTVDRPVDRCREAIDRQVDRLKGAKSRLETVDRPIDRQTCFLLSFEIRIPFLYGIESNRGFLKPRDSVAINKG